jgi:hypothetical protein
MDVNALSKEIIINFNVRMLQHGIRRVVLGLPE